MTTDKRSLSLRVNGDYTITVGEGRFGPRLTVAQARAAWEAGEVTNCNPDFRRLVWLNWDMNAVKRFHEEG